jgi:hypothetical protein
MLAEKHEARIKTAPREGPLNGIDQAPLSIEGMILQTKPTGVSTMSVLRCDSTVEML